MTSALTIGIVTVLYAVTAMQFVFEARPGMSLAFAGYTLANIGLIMEAVKA